MFDAADGNTPSRRTIPPVADWAAETLSAPPPPGGPSWFWVVVTLGAAAAIPVFMHLRPAPELGPTLASPEVDPAAVAAESAGSGRVLVPEGAVTVVEGKPTVFIAERALRLLVATPVDLGARRGGAREILAGVSAGQMVVSDGRYALRVMASR